MEKLKNKKIEIIKVVLIVMWALAVFMFSNQNGDHSENISRNVTGKVVEIIGSKEDLEDKALIEKSDKIIRKMAHYSIYTIGGILIINFAYSKGEKRKKQIIYSIIFGACYAMTDEIHQFFVSERIASIFDVFIDTIGIITGIFLYLICIKIIKTLRKKHKN